MRENRKTPTSGLPRGSRKTKDSPRGTGQEKRAFVRRNLSRARRKEYQELYRGEYVARHGGGEAGKQALRGRNRQQQRSSRRTRYLPLLFETDDHRYRLWTWKGPSKLFLQSPAEAEGMRHLFFPSRPPTLVTYDDQLECSLWAAFRLAAAGLPFHAVSRRERVAYAFRLWNECRLYEYVSAIEADEDPSGADGCFRLVSYQLVDAITAPLDFIRFLTSRIRPGLDELVEELETNGCPLDLSDPVDRCIHDFRATLAAAHGWLVESGLAHPEPNGRASYRDWFREQMRLTERRYQRVRETPAETLLSLSADVPVPPTPLDDTAAGGFSAAVHEFASGPWTGSHAKETSSGSPTLGHRQGKTPSHERRAPGSPRRGARR